MHLGGGDDEGPRAGGLAEVVCEGEVLVAGARGRVDDQVVEGPPVHVPQELLDEAVLLRAPPDDGGIRILQQVPHGHHCQVVVHKLKRKLGTVAD